MGFIRNIVGKVVTTVVEHQPVVATVVLVGSVIATGIVIYKESPKIHKAMDERKEDIEDIKKAEDMSEKEKEDEIEKINKETFKKVLPSALKITAGATAVFVSIAALNFTAATVSGAALGGQEFARAKVEAYEEAIKEKMPDKKEEIDAAVDRKVKEAMAGFRKQYMEKEDETDENMAFRTSSKKVRITDEFGNSWMGYYSDVVNAKNIVNDRISKDGDDVELNDFYSEIGGCQTTLFGQNTYFVNYKGTISLDPRAILNKVTGEVEEILLTYPISPVNKDKKYVYSELQDEVAKNTRRVKNW